MTTTESRPPTGGPEGTAPVVRTTTGAVRGRWEDGLAVFRGIPFAAPPVGKARFQAPRPARPWDGIRDAHAFGPPPPQDFGNLGGFDLQDLPEGDDWLTVNVWSPEPDPGAPRPVMVWIYGGAYKFGHSGSPGYDARHIATEGDVVAVSLNYRLGMEGFASIEGAPANRGLLDQVAALEWVRDNIAGFGGDPNQVTVFGESAGAGSVASLLSMPRAAGLFRRVIAQSVPGTFFSDALARDIGRALAAELGLRPTVADLSTIAPHRLTSASATLSAKMIQYVDRWGQAASTITPFAPVVDGEVLSTTPWQALAAGAAKDIDLLVGHNRDEFRLFTVLSGEEITDEKASAALRLYAPGSGGEQAYRAAFSDVSAGELYERVQTDWLFNMPSLRLAEAQCAGGGSAHVYELTWPAPGVGGVLGACHALDVPLLFGTYGADLGALFFEGMEPSEEAVVLSSRFRSCWSSFARSGDPGWPVYGDERRLVQVMDAEPLVTAYPEERSRRLWEGYDFPPLPLL